MDWIAVKDQKPKVGSWILGCLQFDKDDWYYLIGKVIKECDDDLSWADVWPNLGEQVFSHWMPLPKPPVINGHDGKQLGTIPQIEDKMKLGHLRTDDSGHWYLVPIDKCEEFDHMIDEIDAAFGFENEDGLNIEFDTKFSQYRFYRFIGTLSVVMEEE